MMSDEAMKFGIAGFFGAHEEPSKQVLTLYIPNKDRDGNPVKSIRKWIKEAQHLLAMIGGGSTTTPATDGIWLNPETGAFIEEKTVMIYTSINADRFMVHAKALKSFLHRFGKETDQGEVIFDFDGTVYKINKYKNFKE